MTARAGSMGRKHRRPVTYQRLDLREASAGRRPWAVPEEGVAAAAAAAAAAACTPPSLGAIQEAEAAERRRREALRLTGPAVVRQRPLEAVMREEQARQALAAALQASRDKAARAAAQQASLAEARQRTWQMRLAALRDEDHAEGDTPPGTGLPHAEAQPQHATTGRRQRRRPRPSPRVLGDYFVQQQRAVWQVPTPAAAAQ